MSADQQVNTLSLFHILQKLFWDFFQPLNTNSHKHTPNRHPRHRRSIMRVFRVCEIAVKTLNGGDAGPQFWKTSVTEPGWNNRLTWLCEMHICYAYTMEWHFMIKCTSRVRKMEMCSWNHIHLHILINMYNYETHFICYSFIFTHDVSVLWQHSLFFEGCHHILVQIKKSVRCLVIEEISGGKSAQSSGFTENTHTGQAFFFLQF